MSCPCSPNHAPRALALALLAACSTSHVEGPQPRDAVDGVAVEPARPARTARAEPPRPAVESLPAARVVYDLAVHLEQAEMRVDGLPFIDFGVPGDAQHTLGGWGTRTGQHRDVDGTSALYVQGNYGDVIFTVPKGLGAPHLHVRLRAPRDGDVTLFVDEKELLHTRRDRASFDVISLPLSGPHAVAGEHMLRVRGSGSATLAAGSTGVALDWLALSDGATVPSAPPPASLTLGPAAALAYHVPVSEGTALELAATGGGDTRIDVTAVREDGRSERLGELRVGAGPARFPLEKYAGQVVRLELRAASEAKLTRAAVVEPGAPVAAAIGTRPKHVLLYLIDTLRADHLKPFNSRTRVRTPGLDALVEAGASVFTSAHTQENWTKPSVATLLSSLYPWDHHAVTSEAVVPDSMELLPERLARLGFHRGAFIANGYVSDKFGFKQGWNTYRNYIREGRYSRAEFLAADVLSWLDARPADKPFFLYVHAIDPHVPYVPTAKFLSLYDPVPYSGIVNFSKDGELLEKIKIGKISLEARDKQHLEALYDSEISYHDVHFHAVLEALKRRGLSDDTMVIVVADHGEEFWDHGSVGHGHSVYEELIRIPMLIRLPGVEGARVVRSSSGLVDVLPTVFDALGQPIPEGTRGRSLLPELTGAPLDAPPAAVAGFMDGIRSLVIGHHKLIQRSPQRFTVYDLAEDPGERNDLARTRPLATRLLRGRLGLVLAEAASPPSGAAGPKRKLERQTTRIDKETEAQLRALGYVGTSRR